MNISNEKNKESEDNINSTLLKIRAFDIAELQRRKENSSIKSNVYQNMRLYLSYLDDTNGYIDLVDVNRSILDRVMRLVLTFPNFKNVIEFYVQQIALQLLNPQPYFAVQPVLITGDAGVGKTAFCYALSQILKTPFEVIAMSTSTAGFILSGMSPQWAEGRAGKIVECLAKNRVANPFIMLDELDKASDDARYNPVGALYQLLEGDTAKRFVDEGLEIETDCSHIVWAATANYPELIPEPILSRFMIFHVEQPSEEEMKKVIGSIYKKILENNNWGVFFEIVLADCAVEKIINSQVSPRRVQKEIIVACSKVALDFIFSNSKNKNLLSVRSNHIEIDTGPTKHSIGFY